MAGLLDGMVRAAKLDVDLYEEVEADPDAMKPAMMVVLISSLAAGIGTFQVGGVSGIFLGTVSALVGWYVWAYVTYLVGTKLLSTSETNADHGQLLRTIGFSSSPGVLRALGVVPGLQSLAFAIASIWMLVAMIVAVRQALDYESTWRAAGVCLVGWLIYVILAALLFFVIGGVTGFPGGEM